MRRSFHFGVQLGVLAVAGLFGGFVAGSQTSSSVTADPGRMSAVVPAMSQADLVPMDVAVSSDLATTTITPVRIVDTRPNAAALGGTDEPWGPLETRTVAAAGLGSIPDNAVGVVANVTALNASAPGTFLTLFPTGQDMPNASTLNPTPGEIAFNAATVLLGPDGTFEIYNYTGTVDVIIDVTAYMTRTLADSVDAVEADVEVVEEGVVEVTGEVEELKAYTAVMIDANGNRYPVFRVNENSAIRHNGDWLWFNKLGLSPNLATYFESFDCTGTAYVGSEFKDSYELAVDVIPVMQTNMGYIVPGGDAGLISFGATSSTLKVDDMESFISPETGECGQDHYRMNSYVAEFTWEAIDDAPLPPFEVSVVSQ